MSSLPRPALAGIAALVVVLAVVVTLVVVGGSDDADRDGGGGTVASFLAPDSPVVAAVAIDPRSPGIRGLGEAGAAVPGATRLLDAVAAFFTQSDVSVVDDVLPLFGPRATFATATADPASAILVLPVRDTDGVRELLSIGDDGTGRGAGASYALDGDVLVVGVAGEAVAAARARSQDGEGLSDEELAARLGPGAGRAAVAVDADLVGLLPSAGPLAGNAFVAGLERLTATLGAARPSAEPTLELLLAGSEPPPIAEGSEGGPLVEGVVAGIGVRDAGPTVRFVLEAAAGAFGTSLDTAAGILGIQSGVDVVGDIVDRIEDLSLSATEGGLFARATVSSPAAVQGALDGLAATGGLLGVGVRALDGAVEITAAGQTVVLAVRDDELVLGTAPLDAVLRHAELPRRVDRSARGAVALRVDPEGLAALAGADGLLGTVATLVAVTDGVSGWVAREGGTLRAVLRPGTD